MLATFYLTALFTVVAKIKTADAIDWGRIKPMHLVSMFAPTPIDEDSQENYATPIVFNLESEHLNVDMLPGGAAAMERIFGGNVAKGNEFPYQVGLLLQRPKGLYWCGGSLISDEFVLTAAHCVDMASKGLVFLGAHEIRNAKEEGQMRIMVDRNNFLIYPNWDPRRLKNDIALVKLPRPIEFTENIHPITLPKRSYEYRNFIDKLGIASGWGRYATGVHAISNPLRYVKLQIIDGSTCAHSFPKVYRSTNICANGSLAKSTCNGDSGGPLVVERKKTKKRVLIGLTSFGSIFGCDRGYPSAFTKVVSYLDWILDNTGIETYHNSKYKYKPLDVSDNVQLGRAMPYFSHGGLTEWDFERPKPNSMIFMPGTRGDDMIGRSQFGLML